MAHYAPRRRRPLAERFWEKVDQSGDCWLWLGSCAPNGYGHFGIDHKTFSAHRVAWMLTHGDAGEWCVCHTCDIRPCVNPAHLFLTDRSGNMKDMHSKGRANSTHHRGSEHWTHRHPERLARGEESGMRRHPESVMRGERSLLARLTAADVLVIRARLANGERQTVLASEFGVRQTAISSIKLRQTWKHLP